VYDAQVEEPRASWLTEILQAANALSSVIPHVVESLARETDARDLAQQCALTGFAAARGDAAARRALYGVLERAFDAQLDDAGEIDVVRLDGIDGLLHVAQRRGARLRAGTSNRHYWIESAMLEAETRLGADAAADALARAARDDLSVQAYRDELERERERRRLPIPEVLAERAARLRAIPAADVMRMIEQGDRDWRGTLSGWGRHAERTDLLVVQSAMLEERDPVRLAKLFAVFARRALPVFDARLLVHGENPDEEVRWRALLALGNNTHDLVRGYALERLSSRPSDPDLLGLLVQNYASGDERQIQAALVAQASPAESHSLVSSLLDIYEQNRVPEGSAAMLFAYEETPCMNCRARAVQWLVDQRLLPAALREECRFDADSAIRKAVTQTSARSQ
jgi:hypothetical protein